MVVDRREALTVAPAPTIPAYQVGRAAAPGLVAANGQNATISAALAYFRTPAHDNIMAGFSSQGPTDTSERRVKPDAVAPGVNVLSSDAIVAERSPPVCRSCPAPTVVSAAAPNATTVEGDFSRRIDYVHRLYGTSSGDIVSTPYKMMLATALPGEPARDVRYRVRVQSNAPASAIEHLEEFGHGGGHVHFMV